MKLSLDKLPVFGTGFIGVSLANWLADTLFHIKATASELGPIKLNHNSS